MTFREILWLEEIVDKIGAKHSVNVEEVEYVLHHRPHIRFIATGNYEGEDVYSAQGRTAAGRYLIVFYVQKAGAQVLPISARSMTSREKKLYARQKKAKD